MKKIRSYDVLKSDEIGKGKSLREIFNKDTEKLNVKLARNRESARNSRKRKKVYIELLEKKVAQLQQELANSRKQLELNSNSFNKLCGQSKLVKFYGKNFKSNTFFVIDEHIVFWQATTL